MLATRLGEACLTCGAAITLAALRRQRIRAARGQAAHCHQCSLRGIAVSRTRFLTPVQGNPLAPFCMFIRGHCLTVGVTGQAFARASGVGYTTLHGLFRGYRDQGRLRFARFLREGSVRGYARALNFGAAVATGEILVCLSAHCPPVGRHWLANLIRHFGDPTVAAVWGPGIRPGRPLPASWLRQRRAGHSPAPYNRNDAGDRHLPC